MKIGAILESFRLDFIESIKAAAKLKIDGLQIYSNSKINADMSKSEIMEVKNIISGEGLELSALCGDFGSAMFYYPEENKELIRKEKKVLEIAKELGTPIVTTHIGVVPEDKSCWQYKNIHRVCKELADFADTIEGKFAVETGPEKAILLKDFLDSLNSKGVSVNLDPANLAMCSGDDPVEAVEILKDYIVHTHAKDGVMYKPFDTRRLYAPSVYGFEPLDHYSYFNEVPLGTGQVHFPNYLKKLKEIGYNGYLTIEREVGDNPQDDIKLAVEFLRENLKKI